MFNIDTLVKGIETDSTKYKHIKRNDYKWLCKDLNEIKNDVEGYIDSIRPDETAEEHTPVTKHDKYFISPIRVIQLLFLGVFGIISLIGGLSMYIIQKSILAIPIILFGLACVTGLIITETYRKKK
jgi:hypothetical protein